MDDQYKIKLHLEFCDLWPQSPQRLPREQREQPQIHNAPTAAWSGASAAPPGGWGLRACVPVCRWVTSNCHLGGLQHTFVASQVPRVRSLDAASRVLCPESHRLRLRCHPF